MRWDKITSHQNESFYAIITFHSNDLKLPDDIYRLPMLHDVN